MQVVLTLAALLAVAVLSSASRIDPASRESRRVPASDQALALAEAGVSWAQQRAASLEDGAELALALPVGRVEVRVRIDESSLQIESRGVAASSDGAPVTRAVLATLRLEDGVVRVTDWEER